VRALEFRKRVGKRGLLDGRGLTVEVLVFDWRAGSGFVEHWSIGVGGRRLAVQVLVLIGFSRSELVCHGGFRIIVS
jgi:hypothetical protein